MDRKPEAILQAAYAHALKLGEQSFIEADDLRARIERIALDHTNRACARFLLACALAKVHRPQVDIRKPYTEIGTDDAFSGRTYDERFIGPLVLAEHLPCNATTAFLTPAFRNRNLVLTPDVNLVGRPPDLYRETLELLDAVHQGRIEAYALLVELLRLLIRAREARKQRLESLLASLRLSRDSALLSAEEIVSLIEKHVGLRHSSRLPVLIVAAAYQAAMQQLGEAPRPLQKHTAADRPSGTTGDVEITLVNEDRVITTYEMKDRRVTIEDIRQALEKVVRYPQPPDHYIFITTRPIAPEVQEFAFSLYRQVGVEFVVLDCIGFLRHFLHLFHRLRMDFLDRYQALLLAEPESAVSSEVKEAFLAMRQAAQAE